jgi:hypothetical protein
MRRKHIQAANETLKPGLLIEPQHRRHQFQTSAMRHQLVQTDPAERSFCRGRSTVMLDQFSRRFEQRPILHAGGTGCFAGAARQAAGDVGGNGAIDPIFRDLSFINCPHKRNASARRVHFCSEHVLRRAGLQAKTAVDALVQFYAVLLAVQQFDDLAHNAPG